MFQRTLILAAISTAFASGIQFPFSTCQKITLELQRAFSTEDPYTFPIIPDVNYIRDNTRFNFDFFNLIFKGFSNINCSYFSVFEQDVSLNLAGQNLELNTSHAEIEINLPQHSFTSQLHNYTLAMRFTNNFYSRDPFNLCITRDSLQMIFHADGIKTYIELYPQVARELNQHPKVVVGAINLYLPRFANNLTTTLNNILCKPIPPPTTAIPNPTTENRRTSMEARPRVPSAPNTSGAFSIAATYSDRKRNLNNWADQEKGR